MMTTGLQLTSNRADLAEHNLMLCVQQRDALRAELATVTAERDALRAKVDAVPVKEMLAVVGVIESLPDINLQPGLLRLKNYLLRYVVAYG